MQDTQVKQMKDILTGIGAALLISLCIVFVLGCSVTVREKESGSSKKMYRGDFLKFQAITSNDLNFGWNQYDMSFGLEVRSVQSNWFYIPCGKMPLSLRMSKACTTNKSVRVTK